MVAASLTTSMLIDANLKMCLCFFVLWQSAQQSFQRKLLYINKERIQCKIKLVGWFSLMKYINTFKTFQNTTKPWSTETTETQPKCFINTKICCDYKTTNQPTVVENHNPPSKNVKLFRLIKNCVFALVCFSLGCKKQGTCEISSATAELRLSKSHLHIVAGPTCQVCMEIYMVFDTWSQNYPKLRCF